MVPKPRPRVLEPSTRTVVDVGTMAWVPRAEAPMRREDAAVPRSAVTCGACQRSRTRGSYTSSGDVFICAECQADAKQLFEIQDRIWAEAGEAGESTDGADNPAHS